MRYLLALAMLAVAGSAVAKGGVPPWRQDQRSQTIWNAAHNRFVDQLDYWFEDGDYPRCIQLLRVLNDIEPDNYDIATDLGGTFSAEHGIGELKRESLARYTSEVEIELMRRLKQALDPAGIMNPGKIL